MAPVSITTTCGGASRSSQSTRRRAPAEVSPESPPFTTWMRKFAESAMAWITAGYASPGSSPKPAVSEVPTNRTLTRPSVATVGIAVVDSTGTCAFAAGFVSESPHAAPKAPSSPSATIA